MANCQKNGQFLCFRKIGTFVILISGKTGYFFENAGFREAWWTAAHGPQQPQQRKS